MRPAAFSYLSPRNLTDAITALNEGAVPLAGGQSLLQSMRMRELEPQAIFELSGVDGLSDAIVVDEAEIRIGALTTHCALLENELLGEEMPWLSEAANLLGDVQVRNRGTVLGNLCWADPRANMAVALLASDASVMAIDNAGELMKIPLDHFFTGFRTNCLNLQLATEIQIPRHTAARGAYLEFSRQRNDLALVNAAVVASATTIRIAVGGIDPTPVLMTTPGAETISVASIRHTLSPDSREPVADHFGDAGFKLHVAQTLVDRLLRKLGVDINAD